MQEELEKMKQFPGYTVLEQIDETLESSVYRARKEREPGTVIIKALKTRFPSLSDVARIKHEYELIRNLPIEGIVRTLDIIDTKDSIALVLEDFGGVSLKEFLKKCSLPIERFLDLAVRLSEILGNIHQHNITHRDIKPRNILINPDEDLVKITDFGIATEIKEIYDPGIIEGTLAYISPEQTGRINCAVDYRTDLYSLGVTFYELITGKVPFMSTDPMELIHCHIAKSPIPPEQVNAQVPIQISRVVMKLLSKAPEDRYQNSFGLMTDLRFCLEQLQNSGRIESFDLGLYDHSQRFIIPQILVGRDKELKVLYDAFDRVSQGAVEVTLVAGEPGIGKSTLVNEIHKPIVEKRGYYISGKYDQFKKHVPYSAIIQAFQGLVQQLLAENEEKVRDWKEKLLVALGPNGKIITDVIPEVKLIIGKQTDIQELGPEETQNRFNFVFKNFIRVFTEREHPLVLFLDDLQWADSASLNLIQNIVTDRDLQFLFLIGAYRANEVAAHHPLMLVIDMIHKTDLTITTINLGAIGIEDLNRFVSHLLRCAPNTSLPLAKTVHGKTNGNPFFFTQFLKTLYGEGYISHDPAKGWIWDLPRTQELQVTENVVQFLAERISHLSSEALTLIEICAAIGNRFNAEILSILTSRPIDGVLTLLDSLLKEGLIDLREDCYRFHHDRIQEAAYSLLSREQREEIHFQIGNLELTRSTPAELLLRIFYIVDQLNQGRRLIPTQTERNRLADLNLKAGIKAKESNAYEAGVNYLSSGLELLDERVWETDYNLTYNLHTELMECQYLNRNFNESESLFKIIIAKATTLTDKARAYNAMIIQYTNMGSSREAIDLGLKALKEFGTYLSPKVGRVRVFLELIRVKRLLKKITLEKIIDLPRMEDPNFLAIHQLMLNIRTPAYYLNPNLYSLLALKGLQECIRYGHPPHSALYFISLATIIETVLGDYELAFRLGEMALQLNEKLDNRKIAGRVHHIFAFFILHWKKHVKHELELFSKVYELSLNSGDFIYAGHSVTAAAEVRLRISPRLDDVLEELEKYQNFMHLLKDPLITARYRQILQDIYILKGYPLEKSVLAGEGTDLFASIDRMKKQGNLFGLCLALSAQAYMLLGTGKYEEALQIAAELDNYIHAPMGSLLTADFYFNYSLILTALLKQGETRRKRKFKALISRNQHKLAKWAALCPENFKHKYELIEAEVAGIEGRFQEAITLYHRAIEGARQNEYLQEEAVAWEQAGIFYRDAGLEEEARVFITKAYQCYIRWGAKTKIKVLEDRYPSFFIKEPGSPLPDFFEATTTTGTTSTLLDLSTVMQTSQAISSEIVLDRLLQKIMKMAVVNAGAQRGFLILETDGKLTIEAAEDVEDQDIRVRQSIPLETSDDLSKSIVNYVMRSGENVILGNAAQKGAFLNDPYIRRNRCKSILCAPIMHQGRITGILYMENNLTADAFTAERLELLSIISAQAAISLENAKLFELATTDGLTKLYVHRYFQLLLDQEIHRSRRHNQPFSLVMMDIDNFKAFNDTYGHPLGNEILRNVARTIKKISRTVDIAARYGGEEFVLILPETDQLGALVAAEKIRRSVAEMTIPHEREKLQVTISLGVATFLTHAADKDTLIKSADEALYVAKRKGKNCVSLGEKQDIA